jgi:hypothetical protein
MRIPAASFSELLQPPWDMAPQYTYIPIKSLEK